MTDIPAGYMRNRDGGLDLIANVKPQDLLQNDLVVNLATEAVAINAQLAALKASALVEAQAFKELLAQEYDVQRGGAKGNMTLQSHDGAFKIEISVADYISFGPELGAAKALIDECLDRWSADANDNLRALVNHAFQVNKKGRIDTQRVLGLRKINIDDRAWHRAMEAIADSVQRDTTRTYVRFYKRGPHDEWNAISLDLASV